MNSNLLYRGKVTVKVKNKPPVSKKNSGTEKLFAILNHALVDPAHVNPDKYPAYMSITSSDNVEGTSYSAYASTCLTQHELYISGREVSGTGIKYTSLLNSANISSSVEFEEGNLLFLLDALRQNILAYVPISQSQAEIFNDVSKNSSNSQCVIEWEMSFDNNNNGGAN